MEAIIAGRVAAIAAYRAAYEGTLTVLLDAIARASQTVKRQLGHSPHSTMLERVYAAWIPTSDADYVATNLATSGPKRAAKGGR